MSYSSAMKFDIEKFDRRMKNQRWLVESINQGCVDQSKLHRVLKGITSNKEVHKWKELYLKAASAIRLCLTKNVLTNVQSLSSAKELWERLEGLYQANDISNWLLLKEKFHNLRMDEVKIDD
jgi:hypothetical protein